MDLTNENAYWFFLVIVLWIIIFWSDTQKP